MSEDTRLDPAARAMKHILAIEDADFEALIEHLNAGPLPTKEAEAERRVKDALPRIEDDVTSAIVGFSTAFAGALSQATDPALFLEALTQRAAENLGDLYDDKLEGRLSSLFRSAAIAFIGGGQAAVRDNPQSMLRSHIQSDLRPIPVPGMGVAKHFAVLHRLKINYANEAGPEAERVIDFILDYADLEELRDRVDAALTAQVSLQRAIVGMGGTVYQPYEPREGTSEQRD